MESNDYIVNLRILKGAKPSSAETHNFRRKTAEVMSITDIDGNDISDSVSSDPDFPYRVGEIISVEDFDDYRCGE